MIPRKFRDDRAFKDAVEAHLRKHATTVGGGLQHVRQLVVFDRFTARLGEVLGDRMYVKGGVALETRTVGAAVGAAARATKDLDISVKGSKSEVREAIDAAAAITSDDRLSFVVTANRKHPEILSAAVRYGGVRLTVEAILDRRRYGEVFGLDVVLGHAHFGEHDALPGRPYLDPLGIAAPTLRLINRETHIAEKLHAYTMPPDGDASHENSRVKDLPDLAILAALGAIDAGRVRRAVDYVFGVRSTHRPPRRFPDPPASWEGSYANMATLNGLRWKTLREVTDAAAGFLDPVLARDEGVWDHAAWAWQPTDLSVQK